MTEKQDETRNRTRLAVWAELRRLTEKHPDARIATDTDENAEPGMRELWSVIWHEKEHTIELVFE